jgi:hypothetical protein
MSTKPSFSIRDPKTVHIHICIIDNGYNATRTVKLFRAASPSIRISLMKTVYMLVPSVIKVQFGQKYRGTPSRNTYFLFQETDSENHRMSHIE